MVHVLGPYIYVHVGAPDNHMRDEYMSVNDNNPIRALINASADGALGAVMSLISLVNVNGSLPMDYGTYTHTSHAVPFM